MEFIADSARAVSTLCAGLRRIGFTVKESSDFEAFQAVRATLRPGSVSGAFDTRRQSVEGLWLSASDSRGRVVGLQAIKLLADDAPDFQRHVLANLDAYKPPDSPVDRLGSDIGSRVAGAISGRLAYHGEGFITAAARGRGLARPFIRMGLVRAWELWRPDAVVGILVPATDNRSFARVVGYAGYEADAFEWRSPDGRTICREGLVWSRRADLLALVRDPLPEAIATMQAATA